MRRAFITAACMSTAAAASGMIFRGHPELADAYRANVFLPVSALVRRCTGVLPVAFAEIGMICLVVLLTGAAAACLFGPGKRNLFILSGRLVCMASVFVLCYALAWTPLYACSAISPSAIVTADNLEPFCRSLIESLNREYGTFEAAQMQRIISESADVMSSFFGIPLSEIKETRFPKLFDAAGIAGIYVPFTFESVISSEDIEPALPFTACHELAHQAGLAREEEASFAAWLACRNAGGAFRYSGDFMMLLSAMSRLHALNETAWRECVNGMCDGVLWDFRRANGLYEAESGRNSQWQGHVADTFLKLSGQKTGLAGYDEAAALALYSYEINGRTLP